MNEQDVRTLVREAIERHLGRPHAGRGLIRDTHVSMSNAESHPSHVLLSVLPGSEVEDGMCVIEPRVRCSHCGFCQSYGH
jgi:hypothetical protein